MSKINLTPNAGGTGTLTVTSPNTNTDYTLTLPAVTGTFNTSGAVNEVPAGSNTAPSIYFTGDTNTGIYSPGADQIAIVTGGVAAISVSSGQRSTFPTTIGVGGATPSTSGSGISFPATQSASSDANTLDDYEEGTWTPNISSNNGTGTFTTKIGSYVKVGKQVTIWFVVDGGNSLAAGTTQFLSGLPFTIGSLENNTVLGQMGTNGPATRTQQLQTQTINRSVMYVYIGGSQETTTISYAGGCATYWID